MENTSLQKKKNILKNVLLNSKNLKCQIHCHIFTVKKKELTTAPDNFTEPCCTKAINRSLLHIFEHETARTAFVGKPKKHYEKQPCIEHFYPQILILDTPLALGTPAFLPPYIKPLAESIYRYLESE